MLRLPLRALFLSSALVTPAVAHEGERHETAPPRTELFAPGVQHVAAGSASPSEVQASTSTVPLGGAVLVSGLGDYDLDIEAPADPAASLWFDQGLGHLWGFNHAEAVRAFHRAQEIDPGCALCFWAEAHALGPNINDGMHPEAEARAWEAANRAADLAATPLERALTEALLARYAEPGSGDRAALNQAYAEAMSGAAAQFPGNADVQAFAADAWMVVRPWDYWEAGGETPNEVGATVLAHLEAALALAPDHPGALHLYIHAVEASADPAQGEDEADRLAALDLAAGHLAHMPSHIYNRIGRYADAIAVNEAAIAADEAFLARSGGEVSQLYRYGYVPHNVHFLLVAAQSAGAAEPAVAAADRLAAITSDEVSADLAWVQAIRTAPFTVHAQMSDAATILALPDPGPEFPLLRGFRHYARGLAFVREGDLGAARSECAAIEAMIAKADFADLEAQYMPARDLLGIASRIVAARVAEAEGDGEAAVVLLEEAVAIEVTIPYMEPPYWYAPVHRTLGAVLLGQGRAAEARDAFQAALARAPRDAWTFWGLWQAEELMGEGSRTDQARQAFHEAWLGGPERPTADRL
ncbi:hypothetical protein [Rubellimicrobium roseum]|uniref:Tetratricopeptide repeat protein n=1 Tax=Rubellimicrobium roseum TaxID=687525 RepID=A0A5C4NFA6_9RHOB|nr:hypothetical protein [Rubellimicrobium roseum]TNC71297.1 hypothetical protein FHG71_11925 [Rubellimicrobium roseum]